MEKSRVFRHEKKSRVIEVDLLRGFPIFIVVLYHLSVDMTMIPSIASNYSKVIVNYPTLESLISFCGALGSNSIVHTYLVPLFAGMFLFACGISCALSRSNLKRSLILLLLSLLLSLGTLALSYILGMDLFIPWGILHIMGFSVLIYSLMELLATKVFKKKMHPLIPLAIGLIIFFVGLMLQNGININGRSYTWPSKTITLSNLSSPLDIILSALGIYKNNVDWWPILPFMGLIFIGIGIGLALYGEKKTSYLKPGLYQIPLKPFAFIGSHTLWVYILHQPIALIVLVCVMYGLGFRI